MSELFLLQQFGHCLLSQAQLSASAAPLAEAHGLHIALSSLQSGCVALHRNGMAVCPHCQPLARANRLRNMLVAVQAEQAGLVAALAKLYAATPEGRRMPPRPAPAAGVAS